LVPFLPPFSCYFFNSYQMKTLPHSEQNRVLGGPIALIKAHGSQVFELCAREAAQIYGGLAYTRGGQGEKVERLYREVRAYAIPAGSEEIMLDLGIKMALKTAAKVSHTPHTPSPHGAAGSADAEPEGDSRGKKTARSSNSNVG
jgi:hypothetical protein